MADSTAEVGKRLVELCRQGKFKEATTSLYSPKIVSIEPMSMPNMPARIEGIDAVKAKGEWWEKNHQVHGVQIDGPYPHGERFFARMKLDITPKVGPMADKRMTMEEGCLYTVKDGKIVHEEFFYQGA